MLPLRMNSQLQSHVNWRTQTSSLAPTHPSHFIHGIYISHYLRKPYFQYTTYTICNLFFPHLYIQPAVKIHTRQE